MGHICCLLMYFVPLSLGGLTLAYRIPDSIQLICAISYFGWLILDNMDGKQARRTNTSSPIGMILDHQVDAVSVTITATYFTTLALFGD